MESYPSPVLLTASYVAVRHDRDVLGRVADHDTMWGWVENTRSGAAKVDLEMILIQMVDEIIWLQMKSSGSEISKEKGKRTTRCVCGGREAMKEALLSVWFGILWLLVVWEKEDLILRAKVVINSRAMSTERKLNRRKVSLIKIIWVWFSKFILNLSHISHMDTVLSGVSKSTDLRGWRQELLVRTHRTERYARKRVRWLGKELRPQLPIWIVGLTFWLQMSSIAAVFFSLKWLTVVIIPYYSCLSLLDLSHRSFNCWENCSY